jgi:hypothetical protein
MKERQVEKELKEETFGAVTETSKVHNRNRNRNRSRT